MVRKLQQEAFQALTDSESPWAMTAEERAEMTISCHDADNIPRVKNAGEIVDVDGTRAQVMHNGVLVEEGGYQGGWQARTIRDLKGVHEPQEEKVFYEVLKRIKHPASMMELGSWWSYYTLWYLHDFPAATAVCCEPDPANIALGKRNMSLNDIDPSRIRFEQAASGKSGIKKQISFTTEDKRNVKVNIKSVDEIITELKVRSLDILHMDIQGAEVDALSGAEQAIDTGKVRFLFVSTHHYAISENPATHKLCRDFILRHGGKIIAEHSVQESYSGDGLIVASFSPLDTDFEVEISKRSTYDSLFRAYDDDVQILWNKYNLLASENNRLAKQVVELTNSVQYHVNLVHDRNREIEEIKTLKKHAVKVLKKSLGNNG